MKADRLPKIYHRKTMKSESLGQFKRKLRKVGTILWWNYCTSKWKCWTVWFSKTGRAKQKKSAAHQRKMNWINEYVKDYNDTEAYCLCLLEQIVKMKI